MEYLPRNWRARMERERERERARSDSNLFSHFPFSTFVDSSTHSFRLHPILIARISAEKSFCMPSLPSRCARETQHRENRTHAPARNRNHCFFSRTVSLVVHPHFTAPSFLFFFSSSSPPPPPSPFPPRVFFVPSIFFCAFSTIPLCYVSTPFYDTRNPTPWRFYPWRFHEKHGGIRRVIKLYNVHKSCIWGRMNIVMDYICGYCIVRRQWSSSMDYIIKF